MPSITVTRTYLQMIDRAAFRPAFGKFPQFRLLRLRRATPGLYRDLYRQVGEGYHWRDRAGWTDEELSAHLSQPNITLFVALENDTAAGFYELKQDSDGSVEIAYFGLLPAFLGRGLGKHLLSHAVQDAWALGANRVWLHTCTLDHASALPNYVARGFTPHRTETYQTDI